MNLDGNGSQDFRDAADNSRKLKGDRRAKLRATIDKAALAIRRRDPDGNMPLTESRSLTKAERLARYAGSEEDRRRSTRETVAAAIAKVGDVPMEADITDPHGRSVRDVLRQRYPGRNLSDILARGEQLEAALHDDPVAAREDMLSAYSRGPAEGLPAYKAPAYDHGVRGSIQRAKQDAADRADLAAAEAKHGRALPGKLATLELLDRALHSNPAGASARIAAAYGAPTVELQIPAYQAAQAQKQGAKAHQVRMDAILQTITGMIASGQLPRDDASHHEIANVLENPRFQHSADPTDSLRRAAAIIRHPDHVPSAGKGGKSSAPNLPRGAAAAASKSISGSGTDPNAAAVRGNGNISTREAIRNRMGR